ncbi:hypothetical protein PTKIN_Ptkin08bG0142100 [Pterospermum kingtungense]
MKGIKLPSGPSKLPFIGNLRLLGNLPYRSLEKLSKKYGSVMLLQLGSVPTMIISSTKMAKEVLATHDLDCCTHPASLGGNRFSYNGLDARMKRVQSFPYAREAEVNKLITSLSQAYPCPVNLNEKVIGLADGIIGSVAFGKIYGTGQFKNQAFHDVLSEATNMLASFSAKDFFPSIGRFLNALTGFSARLDKSFYELNAFLQMVLDQHLDNSRSKADQGDLVDFLIILMKDQSSSTFRITENNVKAMLIDTFIGGTVTTSITILWAMSELMKNPRVTSTSHHITPSRGNANSGQCLGYWENPNDFYPERFDKNEIDFKGSDFDLLPFGVGRWICPGLAMGATNVEFSLAKLLYSFDWELPIDMKREDINMEEEGRLAYQRKTPLCLVPIGYN